MTIPHRHVALIVMGLFAALPATLTAQEWTRFRGANGVGASNADSIPTRWSADDYNWRIKLPGVGHSSPVLFGDKLFVTCSNKDSAELLVLCLRADHGNELWRKTYASKPHRQHQYNSYASATPAVDEHHVYITWAYPESQQLLALDHSGKEVWKRDLGPYKSQHGGNASPMVYKDMLIMPNDQDGESYLLAVDRMTGKDRWRVPRSSATAAYGTPCEYIDPDGRPALLFNSQSHGITAVDPANGKVLWEVGGLFDKRSLNSAMVVAGLALGSCGSGGGGNYIVAVRCGTADGRVKPELAWKIDQAAPYVPTPIARGDLLFLFSDGGIVTCVHAPTGEVRYRERAVQGGFFASPVMANGHIYAIDRNGQVVVVKATDKFELVSKLDLGEVCHATPAIAHGRMYIRTYEHLMSLGGEKRGE